ncbi:hypothetical protein [Sphingomonas sp. KC8]|uniref:hypothetical protein n=1 Tax=Sphingomonas sp. KC8 TaxID=1030157 RepID=UPI000248B225|nr:hypothetical protein [Sphingomonas sp. KC8]ARS28409.1 hypothetical protein KC8_14090 [Sphingomonas sp. KC8]
MLAATLLLLAAQPAALPAPAKPAPVVSPVEKLKAIDSQLALDTFKATCWDALRDPQAFRAAVMMAPIALVLQPKTAGAGESYKAPEALLTYVASDNLPLNIPSRQCTLYARLSGAADQLALAARIQQALALPVGRTRTDPAKSQTEWTITGADARMTRLFASTRAAPGGGTELRLAALLLAQK